MQQETRGCTSCFGAVPPQNSWWRCNVAKQCNLSYVPILQADHRLKPGSCICMLIFFQAQTFFLFWSLDHIHNNGGGAHKSCFSAQPAVTSGASSVFNVNTMAGAPLRSAAAAVRRRRRRLRIQNGGAANWRRPSESTFTV